VYGRLWVVILSFIAEWLRVTVIRTRINEHFARSFRLFHGEEKLMAPCIAPESSLPAMTRTCS